ncbi:MAG: sigma-70 family RNA polymerase sigma factor [Clostridia bacterium]|nr:sigma-70 family RNA polymerase sigma factor [Clostridia bacterium]
MQYKVDSYILEYIESEDKYYISFLDSANQECKIEIEKEIFDIYMNSRKAYTKIKNETSRHIGNSKSINELLYNDLFPSEESTEDTAIKNIESEKVRIALNSLTDAQHRRLELHIINEITIRDIAKLEKVQKSQIQKSLKSGIKNFKKFFE